MGRWPMLKPFVRPALLDVDILESPLVDPMDWAASLEPVEFSGLSMSILLETSLTAVLLSRRWRFDDREIVLGRGAEPAAPGPGVFFGGAAAIGITPLPPTAPFEDPALKLVGVLPAVFPPEAPPLTGLSPSLALP